MYNIYENREFKCSFEEICSYDGVTDQKERDLLWNYWCYYEEGKTEHDIEALHRNPDRRTKKGKWAGSLRNKYGFRSFNCKRYYDFFARTDSRLSKIKD